MGRDRVGKSALIEQLAGRKFPQEYKYTICSDYTCVEVTVEEKIYPLQVESI